MFVELFVGRSAADYSNATVAGWLHMHVCICLYFFLVVTFRPRFHSNYLASSATALSKRSTMHTDVSLRNTLNCLPSLAAATSRVSPPLSWAVFNFAEQLGTSPLGLRKDTTEQHVLGNQLAVAFTPWTASFLKVLAPTALTLWEAGRWAWGGGYGSKMGQSSKLNIQ